MADEWYKDFDKVKSWEYIDKLNLLPESFPLSMEHMRLQFRVDDDLADYDTDLYPSATRVFYGFLHKYGFLLHSNQFRQHYIGNSYVEFFNHGSDFMAFRMKLAESIYVKEYNHLYLYHLLKEKGMTPLFTFEHYQKYGITTFFKYKNEWIALKIKYKYTPEDTSFQGLKARVVEISYKDLQVLPAGAFHLYAPDVIDFNLKKLL